jgi:DNA-binding transcriptional MocR family regulator
MTERLDDVWNSRDYPVLMEVARILDQPGPAVPRIRQVAAATGLSEADVTAAGVALERRGLVTLGAKSAGGSFAWFTDISGSAYLLTGLHPDGDDAFSRLISALTQAAELTADPDEKSRIRRAVDGLLGISRDISVGITTAVITAQVT